MSSNTTSNGNSEKSAKKLDLVVPDGVAPNARTEEMSDDLSEETLVNGESISEHSESKYYKNQFFFRQCKKYLRLALIALISLDNRQKVFAYYIG